MMPLDNTEILQIAAVCALIFIPLGIFLAGPVKKTVYRFVARGAVRKKVKSYGSVQEWLEDKKHEDWK